MKRSFGNMRLGGRYRLSDRIAAERSDGVAVLLATHHRDTALAVADRALLLADGAVVADGPPAEVLSDR